MFLVPVLDLLGGVVVRGVGGRRSEYRPVVSRLTRSVHPFDVADAFRDHFGLSDLYVADLDAITGREPAFATFEGLRERGFRCWVDAGIRDEPDARALRAAGVTGIVAGLETLSGPPALERIVTTVGGEGVVFSLDLRDGKPLGNHAAWGDADALAVVDRVVTAGVRQILVLDLARVGTGDGIGTKQLCAAVKERHPSCRLIAGGGVRGAEDLRRLDQCGVDGVLLASALHDGALRRAETDALRL